jgi:HEAT repeat protein
MKKYILLCVIIISFISTSCFFRSQTIFQKNPQLLYEIRADLASDRWDIRVLGLKKLQNIDKYTRLPESEQIILFASFDERALVRIQAIYTLAELNTQSAVYRVYTLAEEDENNNVRWEAITALGILKERQAIPILLEAAKSNDWLIREAAYKSINRIILPSDSEKFKDILANGILDPVTAVKCAALYDIPFYHTDIYDAIKLVLLQEKIPENLLASCFDALLGYALDSTVRELLINHLTDKNPEIRIHALRVLKEDNKYPKKKKT